MLLKYSCPVCGGIHTIGTGATEAVAAMDEIIDSAISTFASSVIKALGGGLKRKYKESRASRGPCGITARDLKKMVKQLMSEHPKTPLPFIDGVKAGEAKMIGALIVEHVNGKKSYLIAESGKPELLKGKDGLVEGWVIAKCYIKGSLPSLFTSRALDRSSYFSSMTDTDFNTNCAAMKLLLAVASDRQKVREGRGRLEYLATDSPIKSLDMSETVYRPPGVKLAGYSLYTSSYDRDLEEKELIDDFDLEKSEEMTMELEHFARPCDRCRLKAPAILCPVEDKRGNFFQEARSFVCN